MSPEGSESQRNSQGKEGLAIRASWGKDPVISHVVCSLLEREDVTPQQIVSIVSRIKKDDQALSVDMLKQFVVRAGSRKTAVTVLKGLQSGPATDDARLLPERLNDLLRLTPQKNMSPWLHYNRARTLGALLLANPSVSKDLIVKALREHCNIPTLQVSALNKPLARWKNTSADRSQDPRQSFAAALCKDCQIFDPKLYGEMIPLARKIAEQMSEISKEVHIRRSEGTKEGLSPGRIERLQTRIRSAIKSLRSPEFTLPALSEAAQHRLEYAPYASFVESLRSEDSFSTPHIRAYLTKQAYPVRGFVAREVLVTALTIDFNLEGGTGPSREIARRILALLKEEMREQQNTDSSPFSTCLVHSMLKRDSNREPILSCEWRDTRAQWIRWSKERRMSASQIGARKFQVDINAIERLASESSVASVKKRNE